VAVDGQGNRILVGWFTEETIFGDELVQSAASGDIFIAKTDQEGTYLWVRTFGGRGFDRATGVVIDEEDNIIVSGSFLEKIEGSEGVLAYSEGVKDVFVMKLDPQGVVLWNQTYGGPGYDESSHIALGQEGQIFLTGWFSEEVDFGDQIHTSAGDKDVFLLQIDQTGQTLWSRRFGSEEDDRGYSIGVREDGHVVVSGTFRAVADFDGHEEISNGEEDVFFLALSKEGEVVHIKSIGGPYGDRIEDFVVTEDSGVIGVGFYMDSKTEKPMAMVYKLDSELSKVWVRIFEASEASTLKAIKQSATGGLIALGVFKGDLWLDNTLLSSGSWLNGALLSMDAMGNIISSVQLGVSGNVIPRDFAFVDFDEVLICGRMDSNPTLMGEQYETKGKGDGLLMNLSL